METKQAAINGLAVVGFITLVILAVALAGNLARYVPQVVNGTLNGISAVVVGVTSIFIEDEETVIVIDNSTTTPDTSFPIVLEPEEDETPATGGPVTNPTPGNEDVEVIQQPTGPVSDPNGLPDLVPTVIATGKLVGGYQANNFVATSTLSSTDRIAIKFAVVNSGTKESGTNWRFNVVMPTRTTYIFEAKPEHVQNLLPGERIEYVIGFDQSRVGTDLQISIAVDHNKTLTESNEDNNGAFAKISVTN